MIESSSLKAPMQSKNGHDHRHPFDCEMDSSNVSCYNGHTCTA